MKFCEIKVTLHSFSLLYSRSDFLTNLKFGLQMKLFTKIGILKMDLTFNMDA